MAMNPLPANATYYDPQAQRDMADANKMFAQGAMLQGAAAMNQPGPAVSPMSVYTPEMQQALLDQLRSYSKQQEALYGTPSVAPGVSVTQASAIPGRERKAEAYKDYLMSQGMSPEQAARKASKRKFQEDKGFKRAIRSGEYEDYGLFTAGGRVKAKDQFKPGGVAVDPQSEALRSALQNLSLQSLGGMEQMMSQGFNQDGLSPTQANSLEALKAKYLDEFSDVYRDSTRGALGELIKTGTAKSSFAPGFMTETAGKAQSRFLTQALGELASREEQMLSNRAARQSQALQNYRSGIMSPGVAGLFTDPQSAQFAANLQQQNIGNRAATQGLVSSALSQPVTLFPDNSTGIGERASGALSGAAGGAALGSVVPGIGTALGAGIGAIGGLF